MRKLADGTYEQISQSLGSLLLVWARVEKSVRDEVVRVHDPLPKTIRGFATLLRTWEDDVIKSQPDTSLSPLLAKAVGKKLQRLREIRNGLCHGLVGISAASERAPAELHWETDDKKHSICLGELRQHLDWLSALPRAVSIISNPHTGHSISRTEDTAENRQWWHAEFSLDLREP